MRTVRDRADARWLPSRFRYAAFKLLAYLILRRTPPRIQRGLVLVVDRDQSALEHHTLAVYILLTVSCYAAAVVSLRYPAVIGVIASIPLAVLAVEAPLYIAGLIAPQKRHMAFQTFSIWVFLTAAAAYFATWKTWVRFPAWLFLLALAVNGAFAVVVRMLRGRIAEQEKIHGVTP
jgi:hypothetical protein